MKRQRDTTPAHYSLASTPSSSSSTSSTSSSCSPFSGSGGPAKRRRTRLTPKQQGGWLRLQEELAAEREKKVRLDWYLKELLVEMENLIAQEREARADQGQGTGAGEWVEGARYHVKLRTYKQYCGFDSGTTILDHSADVPLVRIKPEPTYEHDGDDAAGAYEDFLALSVDDLTSTGAMGSGHAPHVASTHLFVTQHSSVKSEPSPAESTCPPTTTANAEGEGTALEALFESSEGLDVSHFLNFEDDDCHDYNMHSGDDSQSQQECTSSDDEAAGYTSSPSIDFGVVAGGAGAGMGFESWDEIELPKFGSAKTQEERTKAMGAETNNKNESERRGEEKGHMMMEKTEEVKTEGDGGSSDWAFWSIDVLPALGF